ncbi:MAG: DUF92 domain-containing protein [Acidobacteriota bacterium]
MSGADLRSLTHVAMGTLCVTLAWLPAAAALAISATAVAGNLWLLPRLAGGQMRRAESAWGTSDRGLILYPVSVFVLLVLLPDRPTLVAAGWALLAFGDGAASLAGRHLGGPRLPWNSTKSFAGSAALIACGTASVAFLLHSSAGGRLPFRDALSLAWGAGSDSSALAGWITIALIAALISALAESLPSGLDDNLVVPWIGAAVLLGLTAITPLALELGAITVTRRWASMLALALTGGIAAYLLRWVSLSGLIAGVMVGTLVGIGLGVGGFVLLLTFFVLGSAATQIGLVSKRTRGIAQERGGARSSLHALANGAVPLACALFALAGAPLGACALAFAGALGAATFDTVASEIGKWLAGPTFLPERLCRVPAGSPGGVSLSGTLAGAAAAAVVIAVAVITDLISDSWGAALCVWIASAVGAFAERPLALLAASEQPHPEALNAANTLVGAVAALWIAQWLSPASLTATGLAP